MTTGQRTPGNARLLALRPSARHRRPDRPSRHSGPRMIPEPKVRTQTLCEKMPVGTVVTTLGLLGWLSLLRRVRESIFLNSDLVHVPQEARMSSHEETGPSIAPPQTVLGTFCWCVGSGSQARQSEHCPDHCPCALAPPSAPRGLGTEEAVLWRGWDPGPCHSPPGNAEPGRRAHPPSTPAAVPVPTGPWPRHSCAHCSRWSQVLLPRKQGEPCRSDTWDLGDARLGVWSGGWEPLPRSSDAPCTGSQTELPRAPGPSEVGWETAVGAAFPSSAFALGSPEWALHSAPGWVQPSLGDRLTLTEQKGKLRPGAGDPAQGAAADGTDRLQRHRGFALSWGPEGYPL